MNKLSDKSKTECKAIQKAHGVYKMSGKLAVDRKHCEAVYNKIYEIGFWRDRYNPGYLDNKSVENYKGTHCDEFKKAFERLAIW
mmetsp:Transcript_29091/g.44421  ORF Transcript_29091/g.44421 Transcript_29091/m.44421 type:complete len:84 (-) Transcript_29091:341-592(-)